MARRRARLARRSWARLKARADIRCFSPLRLERGRHSKPSRGRCVSDIRPQATRCGDTIGRILRRRRTTAIETVRERQDPPTPWELNALWGESDAAPNPASVICTARGGGALIGASVAAQADIDVIGGRRFWCYDGRLADAAAAAAPELFAATFRALEVEPTVAGEARPVGVCARLGADERSHFPPEALWPELRIHYAGYLEDGSQLRIGYFPGALIGPGPSFGERDWPLRGEYRIEPFADQTEIRGEDVIALWVRDGVLDRREAERRVGELLLVASDRDRQPVGACTAYLHHNEQLGAELWYMRAFVSAAHRQSHLAVQLALQARQYLVERFTSGTDRRGLGVLMEVENPMLRRVFPEARWWPTDFTFIGETPKGAHVRVHFFPGAPAPEPPAVQGSA